MDEEGSIKLGLVCDCGHEEARREALDHGHKAVERALANAVRGLKNVTYRRN